MVQGAPLGIRGFKLPVPLTKDATVSPGRRHLADKQIIGGLIMGFRDHTAAQPGGTPLHQRPLPLRAIKQFRVRLKYADGQFGIPEAAPFDTIIVAAAAPAVPPALLQQLALGGRMLLPLGSGDQYLVLIERRADAYVETRLDGVRFVPLLSGLE